MLSVLHESVLRFVSRHRRQNFQRVPILARFSLSERLIMLASLILAMLFLSPPGGSNGIFTPFGVSAQNMSTQSKRKKLSLHNANHESSIRNIVQASFKNDAISPLKPGNHTSNVAIIVSSSRYWFNYRHVTNALSIYQLLKRGGITDDKIILMLADDIPCNMRNPFRGKIFPRGAYGGFGEDLMEGVNIDYSGTDVTVDAFLRVLLGRHLDGEGGDSLGSHRRTLPKTDENTNVLVYLTGHGGDNFFKFQDGEELTSQDIASAFSQMHELKLYKELLFISDTCQAFTMADEIDVPNVFSVGSSLKGQNSYASHTDNEVGQTVIDRYSKVIKDFVDDAVTVTSRGNVHANKYGVGTIDNATITVMERLNLFDALVRIPTTHGDLGPNSKVGHTDMLCSRRMNQVPLAAFFAAPQAERERQVRQLDGVVTASLWMHDSPLIPPNDSIETKPSFYNQQCISDTESVLTQLNASSDETHHQRESTGLFPLDLKFLAGLAGFIFCASSLSRMF
mmetsp:Transcript_6685/g.13302  ORF Transcript_6685/g.13302 Transcript_6685/m.13302 type:complete len:509 (+) Transcript_6685:87-1613(+)